MSRQARKGFLGKPDQHIRQACNADGAKVAIAFEQQVDILTPSGQIKTLAHLLEVSSTRASSIAWEAKGDGS